MSLVEGKDFIVVKSAYYSEPGFVRQSGTMVVTKNRVILSVIQTIDPKNSGRNGANSFKGAINELKKDTQELKKSFSAIKEYGKRTKEVEQLAMTADNQQDFENKIASIGAMHHKSINISWNEIESYKIGFFFGFQLKLKNGAIYKIRTGKLGKIKKLIA